MDHTYAWDEAYCNQPEKTDEQTTRSKFEEYTKKVIESSFDNSAGTILSYNSIYTVIKNICTNRSLNSDYVDELIAQTESECGYLVKFADFQYVLKNKI